MKNLLPQLLATSVFAVPLTLMNATATLAEDVIFGMANETSAVLVELYVYPANLYPENDLLGADVLYPGEYGQVEIVDGRATCVYNVEAVFEDDLVLFDENVDICALAGESYVFYEN